MRALVVLVCLCVVAGPAGPAWAAPEKRGGKKKAAPAAVKPVKPPAESKSVTLDKGSRPLGETGGAEAGAGAGGVAPALPASDDTRLVQRGERMEFDARLIQGQTAKAGAVYLFERVSTNLRSMVRERTSFREEMVRDVFPGGGEEGRR